MQWRGGTSTLRALEDELVVLTRSQVCMASLLIPNNVHVYDAIANGTRCKSTSRGNQSRGFGYRSRLQHITLRRGLEDVTLPRSLLKFSGGHSSFRRLPDRTLRV